MQKSMPGWLYPVTQDATTVWERWNSYSHRHGFADAAMNSFNHYAYGAVVEWFYEYLGGIRDARDGFKSFTLQPMPIRELKFCETVFCSPYGPISSCWKRTAKKISWEFTVPANTVARIIPPGRELLFLEGTGEIREDANGYLAGPGEYQAESLL
jgi:alpha-L-rhamnosidase